MSLQCSPKFPVWLESFHVNMFLFPIHKLINSCCNVKYLIQGINYELCRLFTLGFPYDIKLLRLFAGGNNGKKTLSNTSGLSGRIWGAVR